MKTILIFGAGGFSGGRLVQAAVRKGWRVAAAFRSPGEGYPGADSHRVDITDASEVNRVIEMVRPDAVVNMAAMAEIDRVEQNRALADQINTIGAVHIAQSCAAAACRYIFFSSDAVFDGTAESYAEDAPVHPLNYYGFTKAEAERQVLAAYPGSVVVRVSLILGFPVRKGNSYLANTRDRLAAGQNIPAPVEEIRTPIDVHTQCQAVLELAKGSYAGILHLGATESISRYPMTCQVVERFGYSQDRVLAVSKTLVGRAPRHKNGVLVVDRARQVLATPMVSLSETLNRAFQQNLYD